MQLTAYQYRIKDQTTGKHLTKMGYAVNFVWNYCAQVNHERWTKFRKTFSAFDLNKLTKGCSKVLGLHAQTINAICEEYASKSKESRRVKLRWRSRKRSLGWIPFKASGVKIEGDSVTYCGRTVRFWLSRCGSVHDRDVNAARNILRSGH